MYVFSYVPGATLYLHSKWKEEDEEEEDIHSAMDMNKSSTYLYTCIYIR